MPQSPHVQLNIARRRVLRKGTHSCWECKRRKAKCVLSPSASTSACNACRRRGVLCVSQEYLEEAVLPGSAGDSGTTLPSPYAGDNGTIRNPRTVSTPTEDCRDRGTMSSESLQSSDQTPCFGIDASASKNKHDGLSRFLHASVPSPEDYATICKANPQPTVLAHEVLTMPYTSLVQNGLEKPERLLAVPGPHEHPVLIARHMLVLASFLQHLHPDLHEAIRGLSESPRAMSERLADLAINLVINKDSMLGSIEGLECVMIESVYHANLGNLRRSWLACRRAASTAQLMGLNRSDNRTQYSVLDAQTEYYPRTMWFRIVFLDRFLCLMLGLPQAYVDRGTTFDTKLKSSSIEQLEQKHCIVASRILERNGSDLSSCGYTVTQSLDLELQRAARSLPSKWWSIPKLDVGPSGSKSLFWNTRRTFAQVLHYNLLNQLHLPYMLRSSSPESNHVYSRITCVNASREVLLRFIALRNFNKVDSSCRIVDFLALMAAITLLLAHLDGHASTVENMLAHQYQSDRAMIEEVEENMRAVNRLNSDALSAHSVELLRRLLAMGLEPEDETPPAVSRVSLEENEAEAAPADQDADGVVNINIPYFGIVRVARQSVRIENYESQPTTTTTDLGNQSQAVHGSHSTSPDVLCAEGIKRSLSGLPATRADSTVSGTTLNYTSDGNVGNPGTDTQACTTIELYPGILATGANDVTPQFVPPPQNDAFDPLLRYGEYPGIVAGSEDWASQGVDLAFFDSVMRGTGKEVSWGAEWSRDGAGLDWTGVS